MINLRSQITQKVLGYFYLHEDAEMYINETARRLGLDSGNLTRKFEELESQGILKSRWKGAQRYYSLDKEFSLYQEYKKIIKKTVGFEEILRASLKSLAGIQQAVVFGSYAADKMDPKSDIDVLVIGDHDTVELQKVIARIQRSVDREINCITMTGKEYREKQKKDPFLRSLKSKPRLDLL
ncbi:MAG: nucleotidyltransferase domain-containing protein [Candidatus Omnitrophica bacterium]|nr:nucleotidyltransferase domain-containing protein [Candidatus Omnitrophota bacterium]